MNVKCLATVSWLWLALAAVQPLHAQPGKQPVENATQLFVDPDSYLSGSENWNLASADMDGDGDLDIVTASKNDDRVNINYNDGLGTFKQRRAFPGPPANRALTLFDANRDGRPDVAAIGIKGELYILLNDGNGGLNPFQRLSAGTMPHDIDAIDLDQDGDEDLVLVNVMAKKIRRYLNDGKGRFTPTSSLTVPDRPRSIVAVDLNLDNLTDLVVGCTDYLHTYLAKGNNTFYPPEYVRSTAETWAIGAGDLNLDGFPDIAAGSYHNTDLCIHLGIGDGTYEPVQRIRSGDHNFGLVIIDVNFDSLPDIITASNVDNAIHYHLNEDDGTFGTSVGLKSGLWNSDITAGDVNGDGAIDIITSSIDDNMINVHLSQIKQNQPEKACLTVRIFDGETGKPLDRAQFSLRTPADKRVENKLTNPKGTLEVCPPPDRDYQILIRAYQWPLLRQDFHMPKKDTTVDIYLLRGSYVYGRIYDEETDANLANAQVAISTLQGRLVQSLRADDQGEYRTFLPFGQYRVQATYPEYEANRKDFALELKHGKEGRRVDVPLKLRPKQPCVFGTVTDEVSGQPVPLAQLVFRDLNQMTADSTYEEVLRLSADSTGHYRACVPYGRFEISANAEGYFYNVSTLDFPSSRTEDLRHDIQLQKLVVGDTIELENIYFDVADSSLRQLSINELNRLLVIMEENPRIVVEISGHTDSDGGFGYNMVLSQGRANSVVKFLTERGIPSMRMKPVGYGEQYPKVPNTSKANKQMNRRTEFVLLRLLSDDEIEKILESKDASLEDAMGGSTRSE